MAATVGGLVLSGAERLRESGSVSARLDAELLLAHTLGIDRTTVLAHPEVTVGDGAERAYEAAIQRRAAGEPVAYIRGVKEFYGLAFGVDARVLIPRPETELLVDLALARVRDVLTGAPRSPGEPTLTVWDVGTGSGAIVVALAVALRRRGYGEAIRFLATDVSSDALAVAVENAVAHGVADLVEFAQAELLDVPGVRADVLVANLPYVPSAIVPTLPVAASFEPRLALDGGTDGLEPLRRLVRGLPGAVAAGGEALLEIGSDQGEAVLGAAAQLAPGWTAELVPDLADGPRVLRLAAPPGTPDTR